MTQDWVGYYTEYYNTVYTNAPPSFRKQAPRQIIKLYDNLFAPVTQDFMPRQPAPSLSGRPISIRTPFQVPITSDPQVMSEFADTRERPKKRYIAFREEKYSASMIQEDGPEWDPLEFADEWEDSFINFRNQYVNVMAAQAMNRKVEYTNIQYLYGDTATQNRFSPGVNTDRKKVLDLSSSDDGLTGTPWSTVATAEVLKDISQIKYLSREIGGREANFGLIGNKTKWSLENSTVLKNALQYTMDYTNTVIGTQLGGINFRLVSNLTYKDIAANSGTPGQPGLGDVRETTWTRDNRTRFMTHTDGGNTYDWGLFLPGIIGATYTARVNPKQTDTGSFHIHSWQDDETEIRKTRMQFGFCPFVDDWAQFFVVKKMALRA